MRLLLVRIFCLPNMFSDILPVHVLWLYVWVLPLHVSRLLSVDIFRIWDARMLTGLLMWSIGRVFLDILFISRALWSLGLQLNKNWSLSHQLRLNTMLWLMRSRRLSGFAFSLACSVFLSHVLFLFFAIIRLPAPFPILLRFLCVLNILIYAIIFFAIMYKLVLLLLLGCLTRICQLTSSRNLFLWLIFLVIVMFWVFLFLPLNVFLVLFLSFSFLFSFQSWWGCVDLILMGSGRLSRSRHTTRWCHVTHSFIYYISSHSFLSCQLIFTTLRMWVAYLLPTSLS